jgi:hypothetical protein
VEEDVISLGKMPPNKAYNLLNSNTGPGLAGVVPVPRSKAAVKYIQAKEKKADSIGQNEEQNVKSLHKYMGPYNRMSSYVPHTTVVLVNTETVLQYEQAAKLAQEKIKKWSTTLTRVYNNYGCFTISNSCSIMFLGCKLQDVIFYTAKLVLEINNIWNT